MAHGDDRRPQMAFSVGSRGTGLLIGDGGDGGGECDCGGRPAVDEGTLRRLVDEAFDRAVERHLGDADADAEPESAENDPSVRSMGVLTRNDRADAPEVDGWTPPSIVTRPADENLDGTPRRRHADPAEDRMPRRRVDPRRRPRKQGPSASDADAYTSQMGYFTD